MKNPARLIFWGIAAVYLVLALAEAQTKMPWSDEAWFAGPAWNLLHKGNMGTPVLDPTASWSTRDLTGIGQHTYWITPLYPFSEFLWFHVVPFSLFSVRLYSVLWGLLALTAWWALIRKLSNGGAALLAMGFIAIDSAFIWGSGAGRMDMMCAALGVSGLATYAVLRERRFGAAIFLSNLFIAASGLAHPLGLAYFAALMVLTLYFDWRRIRLRYILFAAAPYCFAAGLWGVYIAEDPALWWSQFGGNAANRSPGGPPLEWLKKQIVTRFFYNFGFGPDTRGFAHIKFAALLLYVTGAVGALFTRSIRDHKGYRALLLIWIALSLVISAVDPDSQSVYVVHFTMPLAVLLAVWIRTSWHHRTIPRWTLTGMVAVLAAVQLSVSVKHFAQDLYRNDYLSSTSLLKEKMRPGDVVIGSAELAYQLGFDGPVVDDYRLGYRSGRRARFLVLDRNRYQEWIAKLETTEPAAYRYIGGMLADRYLLIQQNSQYKVYQAK